jgi:hypothetical protein
MKSHLAVSCRACVLLVAATAAAEPFRLMVKNGATELALQRTLPAAAAKLATPACAQVLDDFRDARGRTLRENLDALGHTPETYMSLVMFAEGDNRAACRKGSVLAITTPGSRVVFVCPQFARKLARSDGNRQNILIHEALHTLGLEETPPSTHEITEKVVARCGN